MSQPVKLSDELVLDARVTAEVANRSIAGQIEFWAQLGRAIEPLLDGARALALRRAGKTISLSECFATIDAPNSAHATNVQRGSIAAASPRCSATKPCTEA